MDEDSAEEALAFLSCCALNIMGEKHFIYHVDQEGNGLESADWDIPILM